MKYGLTESELKILSEVLIEPLHSHLVEVWIFGSRAREDHKKFSDLDILYSVPKNSELPRGFIFTIKDNMENSNFPYKMDLVDIDQLAKSYFDGVMKDRVKL